jgi:hypothetical protein
VRSVEVRVGPRGVRVGGARECGDGVDEEHLSNVAPCQRIRVAHEHAVLR